MTGQTQNNTTPVIRPTVVNNNTTTASGAQVNTVQTPAVTYYVKFNALMHQENGTSTQDAGNLPYLVVSNTPEKPKEWKVVKANKTDNGTGLIVIPITNKGEYRVYVKEPNTTPVVGSLHTIPYHASKDGTDSSHEVQAWFALKVEDGTQKNTLKATTTLPNTLNRTSNYPTTGTAYTLDKTNTTSKGAKNLGNHILTHQLISDMSRAYGKSHPDIVASTYKTALEKIYSEDMTVGGKTEPHQRILEFTDGSTTRKIDFINSSTAGARKTKSFSNDANMASDEAIRRTHPSVFAYWLETMHALDITYTRVGSTWRPHLGSTRHRYSLALDYNEITANVVVDEKTQQKESVEITLRNDTAAGKLCNPTLKIDNKTTVANKRKIELSRVLFKHLATGRDSKKLGWLGGPWTLKYNTPEINYSTDSTIFIVTNKAHKHHIHLSVGTEQG